MKLSKKHRRKISEGRFIAKLNGVKFGRKPALRPVQIRRIKELARSGDYSHGFIGNMFGVSRWTIWRIVKESPAYAREA